MHPPLIYQDTVRPNWIDYNGHLNDGYYAVVFSLAAERFLDYIGLYSEYRKQTQCSVYTVETHLVYLRELKENASLDVHTRLLGFNQKHFHIFQEMRHTENRYLAATCEVMFLHVNQKGIVRAAPMPASTQTLLASIFEEHSKLEPPPQAGRKIVLK